MTISPQDLTVDEIHKATSKILADPLLHRFYNWSISGCRALFTPESENPAQAKEPPRYCRNCGQIEPQCLGCGEYPVNCRCQSDERPESEMSAQADTLDVDCSVCAQPGYGDHDCPQPAPVAAVGNEDCLKAKSEGAWLGEVLAPVAAGETVRMPYHLTTSERDFPPPVALALACLRHEAEGYAVHDGTEPAEILNRAYSDLESFWRSQPVQPGDCENCESLIAERDELRDQLDRIPDSQPVAAGEMPFLLRQAAAELRSASVLNVRDGHPEAATAQRWTADALERWWRSQPAPVAAVRMTPELEEVLSAAWLWSIEPPADTEKIRDAIHAVRDQAAAQTGKLEKVRDLIVFARANAQYLKDSLNESEGNYVREMMHDKIDAALAELDSYEGKVGG